MPPSTPSSDNAQPPDNGPIDIFCQIMHPVLASTAEAELGALFLNAKHAYPLQIVLLELGHPQPTTPIQTDNTTATGIANDNIKQKHSKSIDMHFYWIQDCIRQGQYYIFWHPGATNKVDYFTKHHPDSHHQAMWPAYLHSSANAFLCLHDPDSNPSFGEGVFMACNQACQVAKATVIRPISEELIQMCAMPTEPKDCTLWTMLSTSLMAGPHNFPTAADHISICLK